MNRYTIRLYWNQMRHHKTSFFVALVAIPIGATIIDSILPFVLSQAISELSKGSDRFITILWIAGGVGLLGALLNFIGFQALMLTESHVLRRLRQSTFAELIGKDNAFFANQKIGAMTSKYIDFVRSYVVIQDLLIIRTLGFILTVGTGLTILAIQSPIVALIIASLIVVLALEIRWSTKKRAPWRHERKTLVSEIHGEVADSLTNNLIVKSYAGERREIDSLNVKTSRFTKVFQKDIGFIVAEGSVRVLLMVIVQVITIVISAMLIADGRMDIAAAIFVLAYMQRIGSQLFTLSDIINGYDMAFLEAQPMSEMLSTKDQVFNDRKASTLQDVEPSVAFNNVSFSYPDSKDDVVRNVSFDIPAGQKVGLVGHSGAGKSTIVNLLLRFSDVTDGSISVGDKDIRDVTQESLRQTIAYVPQEPLLFHRTLRENILYGNVEATEDQLLAAAEQANATEFIATLPSGFDTMVGERGIKLSGGQRQRIAIARAILKDAPILVLDEATSALDSESEKMIQASLDELMEGRTSIVIAHRLSTIAKLDRIIVLDNGRVVEDGSHQALLKKKGIYARLWSHQSGGFIEE